MDDTLKAYEKILNMTNIEENDLENVTKVNYDYEKVISVSRKESEVLRTISGN